MLFISYVGYYFCRVTFPVALPSIADQFQFSNTQTGLILSAFYTIYAVAKLANGFLGDRLGGKIMLLIGIAGTVACNAAFGLGRELSFFVLIWGTNAYFQSMGWLSLVPIMARWYARQETGRTMGVMSLSYQLGDFIARSSAALLIVALGWHGLFWVHSALLALLGLALLAFLKPSPAGFDLPETKSEPATDVSARAEAKRWRRAMLTNP